MSLKAKTIHSIKWSFAGTAGISILQFGITIVLARLLEPKDYGLLALATLFINLGFRFSRMGLGPALIQREVIDDTDIRASYTLAMAMGIVFGLVIFFAAPLAAVFFNSSDVTAVIRVMAFSFLFQGFSLTPESLLMRNLNYKALARIEVLAFLIGNGAVAITCAVLGFGVWSLVTGMLTAQALKTSMFFLTVRHSLRPVFEMDAYRRTLSLGARFSVVRFLDFLYCNMNTVFIGFVFGQRLTGLYDRAYALGRFPIHTVTTSTNRVMFPAMSRLQDREEERNELFLVSFLVQGILCVSFASAIAVASREIVLVVLGEKWSDAIIPLQFMALFSCVAYLVSGLTSPLESSGHLLFRFRGRVYGFAVAIAVYSVAVGYGFHVFLSAMLFVECVQFLLHIVFVAISFRLWAKSLQCVFWILLQGIMTGIMTWCATLSARALGFSMASVLACQILAGGSALATGAFLAWNYQSVAVKNTLRPHVFFWKNAVVKGGS